MFKDKTYFKGILYGLIAASIWGGFPVMTRYGVSKSSLDALDITFIRFIISGLLLLPYFIYQTNFKKNKKVKVKGVVLMTIGLGAPYMLTIAEGLKMAPVQIFAIVTPSIMIIFTLVIGSFVFKNRINLKEYIGVFSILIGLILVGYFTFTQLNFNSYLFFILGGVLWAVYTISSKYYCDSALYSTAIVCVFSMILYTPFYLFLKGGYIFSIDLNVILPQVFYQGILVSIVALFFYSRSVLILGSTKGSIFGALVPVLATIISYFFLKEEIIVLTVFGLILITSGIFITILKKN